MLDYIATHIRSGEKLDRSGIYSSRYLFIFNLQLGNVGLLPIIGQLSMGFLLKVLAKAFLASALIVDRQIAALPKIVLSRRRH